MITGSAGGQEGVTIVDTGDTLRDDDLLLIMMLLPAAGGLFMFFFTKQVPIKDRKMMPVTDARLMMSGHFIFSNRGVASVEGISAIRLLLTNSVELIFIFLSSKCSSITSILCFKMCISSGLFELNLTELQLIFSE